MPAKKTVRKARKALRQGKKPSTAAGEFVHEEIEHVREGKHGARSTRQAIAIGLSKARRAGVPLEPPRKGQASKRTRKSAARALAAGRKAKTSGHAKKVSRARSRAAGAALRREGRKAGSRRALSRQARQAARRRRQR